MAAKLTKAQTILKLVQRSKGASLGALEKATGWQPHSVRAALTGLRKSGHIIERAKDAKGVTENDWGKYKVELHKRIVSPLLGVGYAMVGLACLLYGPITRRSQTMRIVTAVSVMIALQGAALGLENIIAKNLYLTPLLYALAAVPILAGTIMLLRHPRAPRPSRASRRGKLKAA